MTTESNRLVAAVERAHAEQPETTVAQALEAGYKRGLDAGMDVYHDGRRLDFDRGAILGYLQGFLGRACTPEEVVVLNYVARYCYGFWYQYECCEELHNDD